MGRGILGFLSGVFFLLLSTLIEAQEITSDFLNRLQKGHKETLQNYGYPLEKKEFKIDVVGNNFFSICYDDYAGSFYTEEGDRVYFLYIKGNFSSDQNYNQQRQFIISQKIRLQQNTYTLKWILTCENGPESFALSLELDEEGSDYGVIKLEHCLKCIHSEVEWWKAGGWVSECKTDWKCYIFKAAEVGTMLINVYCKSCLTKSSSK